jgi:pimeloyl-ACP methyl ester carboxylesterase
MNGKSVVRLVLLLFSFLYAGWDPTMSRAAETYVPFEGEKTTWHDGFERFDYVMDEDKVSCIFGKNPALRSLMSKTSPLENLAPLAKAGVPIMHVSGSLDPWLDRHTRVAQKRYRELGGQITVILNEGDGHYPLAPKDRQPVVDFIVKQAK